MFAKSARMGCDSTATMIIRNGPCLKKQKMVTLASATLIVRFVMHFNVHTMVYNLVHKNSYKFKSTNIS